MSIKTGLRVSAIFILLIVFASGSTAQEVTLNDAKRAAEIWNGRLDSYDSYVLNRAVPFSVSDDPIVGHYIIRGDNDRILAYVYNLEPRGFVAVSADQGLKPIIAYSRNSDFDPEPNPQNILLQLIKSDISERLRILERNINRNELRRTASEEWEELYSGRLE
ncbi:MAG: hypothetical protein GY863_11885, partial [bacterium]|nr:hypothetical protein [bacterium]